MKKKIKKTKQKQQKEQSQADIDFYDPFLYCDDIEISKEYNDEINTFLDKIIDENK